MWGWVEGLVHQDSEKKSETEKNEWPPQEMDRCKAKRND
jgi:hypothetical protein